jgi:membrane protein DedA with SNARE-associated domain
MAAGVLQYPRKKFVTALTAGRTVRFLAVAYLGRIYGTAILHWLGRYYKPFLYALIAAGVAGGIAAFVYFKWYRPKRQHQQVGAPH